MSMLPVVPVLPVLEIGGSHVSAAVVDAGTWRLLAPPVRLPLSADVGTEQFLGALTAAAGSVAAPGGATWGVAMPDPFDYARGVARFRDVGKFDALDGLDVGAELRSRLAAEVVFLNDADAFTLGEWSWSAAAGTRRWTGLTLGTGVGSGWVVDGRVVVDEPGVPPGGRAHRLTVDGRPLEEVVSRRAIRAAYAGTDPARDADPDVRDIAGWARQGEQHANAVLGHAFTCLGRALGPAVHAFGADVLVVGGSMAGSWDLFEQWFRAGAPDPLPPIRLARDAATAPLIGAARYALAARTLS